MAIAPSFTLFLENDQTHIPSFFNSNDDEDEFQIQLLLDAAFAEELQFQEAVKASLFANQIPSSPLHVEAKGESSLSFCEICMERKESGEMIKNGVCLHSFCVDCIRKYLELKFKEGIVVRNCPGSNCECVLAFDTDKHLLTKDFINLLEKALSLELIHVASSKELQMKKSSKQGSGGPITARRTSDNSSPPEVKTVTVYPAQADSKQIVLVKQQEEPATRNVQPREFQSAIHGNGSYQSRSSLTRGNEGPKLVYKPFNNLFSPATDSIPCMNSQEKVADDVKRYERGFAATAPAANNDGDNDSDSDVFPDTDDYDSEESPRSPEACKKSKWFKKFVNGLEHLSIAEIKDAARQWHCAACQGGAGAIKRYLGVQTLIQHAKTKGSARVRLHRELAQLLEEKLHSDPATSATPNKDACAKWIGLKEEKKDHQIVWPPMVVITNTIHKKDENNKWIGMTTEELLDLFSSYDGIVKAQHSYNWKGHCGTSILIFESSAKGYLEAERLHKHFAKEGTDRNAWNSRPVYFLPGGERQLYGYMALEEDVDNFNKNAGKPKLKYEMRSYQEMVVDRIKQMSEENQQLLWLKNRVAEQLREAKSLKDLKNVLEEKLLKATKELAILRNKANLQHEQNMEELGFLEQFYKDQIKKILEARKDKDEDLENTEQETVEQSNASSSNINDDRHRKDEITEPTNNQSVEKERVSEIGKKPIIQEETNLVLNLQKKHFNRMLLRRGLLQTEPAPGGEELPEFLESTEQETVEQSNASSSNRNDYRHRKDEITEPTNNQTVEKKILNLRKRHFNRMLLRRGLLQAKSAPGGEELPEFLE